MSQFYARYIPPTEPQAGLPNSNSKLGEKRKHDDRTTNPEKSKKKRKIASHEPTTQYVTEREASRPTKNGRQEVTTDVNGAQDVLNKYRITSQTTQLVQDAVVEVRKKPHRLPERSAEDEPEPLRIDEQDEQDEQKPGRKRKKKKAEANTEAHTEQDIGVQHNHKHQKLLSKYTKSTEKVTEDANDQEDIEQNGTLKPQTAELHGLEPIPQPIQVEAPLSKPTYSTLPAWQAAATSISPSHITTFQDLGLSELLLSNLTDQGITQAFPVQSAVVPLLLDGRKRYHGDLCVSATTGSGKTLAYVLPLIESLRSVGVTKLRAVIVVPTRELVKQVRQTCDLCSAGTELRIATAVGSRSMKEEQDALVLTKQVHDPVAYLEEQNRPIEWNELSNSQLFMDEAKSLPKDYIIRYSSKVDILICTPGRLVDHLKSTPGFSLADVKWLVIDEADRLLNESYQEWIEEVGPALQSNEATKKQDETLASLRMILPRREVSKVLLSATMTHDISKLNSIGLVNPKLLVLGITSAIHSASEQPTRLIDQEPIPDASGAFNLPLSLAETAVLVKDGADKPLLLLELLQKQIGVAGTGSVERQSRSREATESSPGSSDNESTSSSGSISDSDLGALQTPKSNLLSTSAHNRPTSRALIFARSTASAQRLSRLLALLDTSLSSSISTLTRSTTSSASSRRAFASFRSGKTSILIATDRASRGLDVPNLEHVISYDVPNSVSSYVHRVGRTARAGKQGRAWTFVEHREGKWFWEEIGGKGKDVQESKIVRNGKIAKISLEVEDQQIRERYEQALQKLSEEVRGK